MYEGVPGDVFGWVLYEAGLIKTKETFATNTAAFKKLIGIYPWQVDPRLDEEFFDLDNILHRKDGVNKRNDIIKSLFRIHNILDKVLHDYEKR